MLPIKTTVAAARLQSSLRTQGVRSLQQLLPKSSFTTTQIICATKNARLATSFSASFLTSSRTAYASSISGSKLPLTADKYPYLKRNQSYKKLADKDIDYFKSILAPSAISQDEEDLEAFNIDWMQKYRGQSKLVLKPSSTDQVSKILKYCNDNK
ncbi:hypothetical protein BX616_009693 [Lobosporangium transversale]|nr:hypothetical protein BX616_009693 [Lobosporangium transversale]